jgi:hypothetical protein
MEARKLIAVASEVRTCCIRKETEVMTEEEVLVVDWHTLSVISYSDSGIDVLGELDDARELAKLNDHVVW